MDNNNNNNYENIDGNRGFFENNKKLIITVLISSVVVVISSLLSGILAYNFKKCDKSHNKKLSDYSTKKLIHELDNRDNVCNFRNIIDKIENKCHKTSNQYYNIFLNSNLTKDSIGPSLIMFTDVNDSNIIKGVFPEKCNNNKQYLFEIEKVDKNTIKLKSAKTDKYIQYHESGGEVHFMADADEDDATKFNIEGVDYLYGIGLTFNYKGNNKIFGPDAFGNEEWRDMKKNDKVLMTKHGKFPEKSSDFKIHEFNKIVYPVPVNYNNETALCD